MAADLKNIYRAFDPGPLSGEDDDLYVPLDEVRGSSSPVPRLTRTIRLSEKATFQLLAGSPGNGKSTELYRVQSELENGEDRFFTVFCPILEDIDPSDADFPEVLMAITRQVACELRSRLGIELKPGYFTQRWADLKGLLGSEVKLESLDLSAGLAKVTAAIKSSPSTRNQVRQMLEPTTGSWIDAANGVLSEAMSRLAGRGYSGLAVLVDDLERLSTGKKDQGGESVAERLFLTRHAQLTAFKCHMIYNIPLALAYSCKEREIADSYDMTAPPVIPMAKLFDHAGKKHAPGIEKFRTIIARRIEKAGAEQKDVFASDVVRDKVVKFSGGQPRFLITLIRDALTEGDLPITGETVDRVARKATHSYSRQLREEHWRIIEQVRKTHRLVRSAGDDPLYMELLASRAILQYLNGKEWYGLNPLLPKRTRQ